MTDEEYKAQMDRFNAWAAQELAAYDRCLFNMLQNGFKPYYTTVSYGTAEQFDSEAEMLQRLTGR